ncbi:MAG: outer membrane beta-barrel protein [Acidobacteriaceae bacterium]
MRIARIHPSFFFLAVALIFAVSPSFAPAQTSIALNAYGAFTGTTTGNGVQQSPSNQVGGLFQLRHTANPVLGFEATYSFNRADQTYSSTILPPTCGIPCGPYIESVHVPANAHEITADWVPSVHIANIRPFGILGVGVLLNVPSGNQTETTTNGMGSTTTTNSSSGASTSAKAVYVYGAGLDWGLIPHIGLRVQYRGNLYQAPDISKLYSSTDAFTHTAEPMIGIYFRL